MARALPDAVTGVLRRSRAYGLSHAILDGLAAALQDRGARVASLFER